jgi:hypothetical protein
MIHRINHATRSRRSATEQAAIRLSIWIVPATGLFLKLAWRDVVSSGKALARLGLVSEITRGTNLEPETH